MAYSAINLHNISGHENTTLGRTWWYAEAETVANMAASGYFNSATKLLTKGDIIFLRGSNGTGIAQVSSATGAATVTVAALTALA
jgi:hypothetical protein